MRCWRELCADFRIADRNGNKQGGIAMPGGYKRPWCDMSKREIYCHLVALALIGCAMITVSVIKPRLKTFLERSIFSYIGILADILHRMRCAMQFESFDGAKAAM